MFIETAVQRVRRFKDLLVEKLGDLVECVVLTGSHARGDARPDSDIDVWVFLAEASENALQTVGQIVDTMGAGLEINPQCLTFGEACSEGFKKGFSVLQLHLDGIVLHGTLKVPEPTRADIRQDCVELAAFCLTSARHYMTVREPEQAMIGKLDRFLLKPLVWAIRYEVFLLTGKYHKTTEQLCQAIADPDTRNMVSIHMELRRNGFNGPCMPVINTAASVCSRIIAAV